MSYHREALRYKDEIIHRIMQKNRDLPFEIGEDVGRTFINSRDDFEDFVIDMSKKEGVRITTDFIPYCAEIAIVQIFKDIIREIEEDERRRDRRSSGYRFGQSSRSAPSYGGDGGGFRFGRERKEDGQRELKKLFRGGKNSNNDDERRGRGNGLFDDAKPPKKPKNDVIEDDNNVEYDENHVVLEKITVNSNASFAARSASQILGATLKNQNSELYKISRTVFSLKEGNKEKIIKNDNIDFGSGILSFDSPYDAYQFLDGNMSREDVTWGYIRTINYRINEGIEFPHDRFFLSYDKLVDEVVKAVSNFHPRDDVFAIMEKFITAVEIFRKLPDQDFQKAFEEYIVDFLSTQIRMRFRISNSGSIYSIQTLEDLLAFSKEQDFEKLQSMKDFEPTFKELLYRSIGILAGKDDIYPIQLENDMSTYIRSRKYMIVDPETSACSFDYWFYVNNNKETIKNSLVEKMKERVLISRPKRTIITNIFSPQFIRLTERAKKGIIIPPRSSDNIIFGLLNEVVETTSLPNELLHIQNERGEAKIFGIGMTLDGHVIVD